MAYSATSLSIGAGKKFEITGMKNRRSGKNYARTANRAMALRDRWAPGNLAGFVSGSHTLRCRAFGPNATTQPVEPVAHRFGARAAPEPTVPMLIVYRRLGVCGVEVNGLARHSAGATAWKTARPRSVKDAGNFDPITRRLQAAPRRAAADASRSRPGAARAHRPGRHAARQGSRGFRA